MNKLLVGSALSLGFVCLLSSTNILFQSKPSEQDKSDAWVSFVVGISSAACGGWMIWNTRREEQAQKDLILKLDSIVLEQIQANQGNISCISFAIAAKISIEESQQYLEQTSVQLNGKLKIDDEGGISYHFPLSRDLM
jgi:hypothetical protein